jgi:hypothetical protein
MRGLLRFDVAIFQNGARFLLVTTTHTAAKHLADAGGGGHAFTCKGVTARRSEQQKWAEQCRNDVRDVLPALTRATGWPASPGFVLAYL